MIPAIWTGMYAQLPLPSALRILHEHGWRTFEISTEHLVHIETCQDPNTLIGTSKESLQKLGLSAPQAHSLLNADVAAASMQERERDINRLLRHIEISAALGVKQVVIHPGGLSAAPGLRQDEILKHNRASFRRLGGCAGEQDIRIGIENMPCSGFSSSGSY